jgi:hypothetical protein
MEELRVQSLQCLLEDGVAGRSRKTKLGKEGGVEDKLSNKGPVAESGVELEPEKHKESRKGKVRRSAKGRGLGRYHIAKLDKFSK